MSYLFYPGCSLTGTAQDYEMSGNAVMAALGVDMKDLEDWNCCGASAAASVEPDLGLVLAARNLAIAELQGKDIAVACPFCYTGLRRARTNATAVTPAGSRVREALAESGHAVSGSSQVRHLLEIVVHQVGLEQVKAKVRRPLAGLKVAPYYGCQLGRPGGAFADPELPMELDQLLIALGAEPVWWNGRARCCGSSTILTKEAAALGLVDGLLGSAQQAGAHLIATACSFCQLNLDAYQGRINSEKGRSYQLPVLYFTQLMGLAFGLEPARLGIGKSFVPPEPVLGRYLEGVLQS